MMISMIKRVVWIFLITLCFGRQLYAAPMFVYETFTLKNGLQFILMQNKRAPIVSYTTWFKVGSADELPGKTGLAHYLEHLMESALPEVQMGQFLEDFHSSDTHSNAFTSQDFTYYYKMVTTDHLPLLMQYEAGRMRGVAFNKDKFETEKNVILEERLTVTENDPAGLANEQFNSQFFTVHPYKNPIIGWEKDIRALTFEDIKDFHKKWYHPNNAFIILSGDFNPAQVRAWAETYYGDIPGGPKVERSRVQEPSEKPKIGPVITEHPRAAEFYLDQIYPLPDLKKQNYQDLLALSLLSVFLSGDFEGSLYEILVHKKKLATGFSTQSSFMEFLDPWSFAIYVTSVDGSKTKEIETIINGGIQQIAQKGLKPEDLARVRRYSYNEWVMQLDDIYKRAHLLGTAISAGFTIDQINSLHQDYEKLTSADIQRVIKKYLVKERAVTGILKKPTSLLSPLSGRS